MDRNFVMLEFHDFGNPDIPNSDSPGSFATYPCCLDGSDLIWKLWISIPICKSFLPLENLMLQMPTRPNLLSHLLPRSTVEILSQDFGTFKVSIFNLMKT
jgi:hypothetical protein